MKKVMWMIGLMALLALTACGGQTEPGREPAAPRIRQRRIPLPPSRQRQPDPTWQIRQRRPRL